MRQIKLKMVNEHTYQKIILNCLLKKKHRNYGTKISTNGNTQNIHEMNEENCVG